MKIAIPREIKTLEARVALLPSACAELVKQSHEVYVQAGAGLGAGYTDDDYIAAGCRVLADAEAIYTCAQLLVKVKEPQDSEVALLREGQILFSYLHLAALPELTQALCQSGVTAIGFETVQTAGGLPLLAPMSDIAGRLAVQIGANLLQQPHGGRGLLLGGLPGAERGEVVILGAGMAGGNAALVAQSLGATVTVFDPSRDKLTAMRSLGANVTGLYPVEQDMRRHVEQADLLIGAVLIPGAQAPRLVQRDWVRAMKPGSVIIDIAVDQGGCIETIRPTDYEAPTYIVDDVVHFGVTNMPGAVPRSASQALSAALLPYILRLSRSDWKSDSALAGGINVESGQIVHPALK